MFKSLRQDNNRVCVPADKARSLVVLDKKDYETAILKTLAPPNYEELPHDPSPTYVRRFQRDLLDAFAGSSVRKRCSTGRRDARLKKDDPAKYKEYQQLRKTHGRAGAYYGLVKTHKWNQLPHTEHDRQHCLANLKLRPINPGVRFVDQEMAKHLTRCLQVLPRPPVSVSSPLEVLELLRTHDYAASSCTLLSLDVESMYPSIPVDRVIPLVQELLEQHQHSLCDITHLTPIQIIHFLQLSIRNTVAAVTVDGRERFFAQKKGLAMGKAYSPVLADQFMGWWERNIKNVAEQAGVAVVFICRYMDDFLAAVRGSKSEIQDWVCALNAKDPDINITCEMEIDRTLPFLDILIRRCNDCFQTSVYRKKCNTNQVVPFNSFTDPKFLRSAIISDTLRAIRYCQPAQLQQELAFINQKFSTYGYPSTFIHRVFEQSKTHS